VTVSGDPANMRAVDPDDVRRVVNLLAARQAKADGR
jgi:hypothetical protein